MSQVKTKNALIFIFITMLIDVMGLGIIIPVIPNLIRGFVGQNTSISEVANYAKWLFFAYAFMQFWFAPVMGALSDRFGRRPVILISLVGFGLDYWVSAFAPSVGWLFAGRILAGITGASFTAAGAYIADISITPEERAKNFGMIGAAFGIGFIIGPVLGSFLGEFGTKVPFIVSGTLALGNALYGYFVLPESLKNENRRAFDWRRANAYGSLKQLTKYPVILGLVTSLFLIYLAGHAVQGTWQYVTIEKFNWTMRDVGLSLGFVGFMVALVQGGLNRILLPKLGQIKAVFVGFSFYAFGFMAFAFASEGWMMYAFMIPYAFGGLAGPSLQGIITTQVPANSQGELQGALTSLISVTSIIGPLVMLWLFEYFSSSQAPLYFPGMPFIAGSVLTILSMLFAISPLRKFSATK
jgi:MFS transporter, DHA1 family, tetracycline resistance protein